MATREEISRKIRRDLEDRGLTPDDPTYEFALQSMETMNEGVADLDDELGDIAERLAWLAQAPTWVNRREPNQFVAFVDARLSECEATLAVVRARWEKHCAEKPLAPSVGKKP